MDRRVKRTKDAIRRAYFELQDKNENGHISITELAELADIDRKTFYLHYDSVEEIIDEFCNERIAELLCRLKATDFFDRPIHVNLLFEVLQKMIEEDISTYKRLALSKSYDAFWDRVYMILVQSMTTAYKSRVSISPENLQFYAEFFASGLISSYRNWLKDKSGLSLEQIGTNIIRLANQGIMDYFI